MKFLPPPPLNQDCIASPFCVHMSPLEDRDTPINPDSPEILVYLSAREPLLLWRPIQPTQQERWLVDTMVCVTGLHQQVV